MTTKWGSTELGRFTSTYSDARGWRNGQTSGSSSGTPAGSWTKVLGLGDGVVSSFGYNDYGELTSAPTPAWQNAAGSVSLAARNFGWSYDRAGNRLTEAGPELTTYTPNALNQYSSITGQRAEPGLDYDDDGNLVRDGTWTYAYDGENRLKTLTKSGQTIQFTYDYLGRRIRKVVTGTGAYDITFLYTGWSLIAELASNGTTVNKAFVWGPDFSNERAAAGGAGSLLAQISGGTVNYTIPDSAGNIVGYVNSSGSIVAAVEYSPFGKGLNVSGSWQSFPIGFSGQYMDWETGIVYYGLRYYAPKHGRFINRDPMEEAGGLNLYAFVGNGPTYRWDLLGLGETCYYSQTDAGTDNLGCYENGLGEDTEVWLAGDGMWHDPTRGFNVSEMIESRNVVNEALDFTRGQSVWTDPTSFLGAPKGQVTVGAPQSYDAIEVAPNRVAQASASGSQGMGLSDYQALAAQLGWKGFTSNLSERQQLYYGKTAADILQLQAQGRDMSGAWSTIVNEVPGLVLSDADRYSFAMAMGAMGMVSGMGGRGAPPGTYRPAGPLPRDANGNMVPSSPYPHTQLGTGTGRAGNYTNAREWGQGGQWVRDINFTNHGRPNGHPNPHQHRAIPNPTGGTPQRGPAEPWP